MIHLLIIFFDYYGENIMQKFSWDIILYIYLSSIAIQKKVLDKFRMIL